MGHGDLEMQDGHVPPVHRYRGRVRDHPPVGVLRYDGGALVDLAFRELEGLLEEPVPGLVGREVVLVRDIVEYYPRHLFSARVYEAGLVEHVGVYAPKVLKRPVLLLEPVLPSRGVDIVHREGGIPRSGQQVLACLGEVTFDDAGDLLEVPLQFLEDVLEERFPCRVVEERARNSERQDAYEEQDERELRPEAPLKGFHDYPRSENSHKKKGPLASYQGVPFYDELLKSPASDAAKPCVICVIYPLR